MAKGVNVDSYNIAAIEQKMQRMSKETASKLGEPTKKAPEKKNTEKNTEKKKK